MKFRGPKHRHITSGSRRGVARRRGRAERSQAFRAADRSVFLENNQSAYPSDLSSLKSGHTLGGSGRGARRGGVAGSGRTGCQQNCSPRGPASFVSSKASNTRRLNVSLEARTSELLCKPMEAQNRG